MKKILISGALLVIAGAAASPYLLGSQIEKTAREQVDLSNQKLVDAVKSSPQINEASFKIESYEKGFMSSKAKTLLNISLNLPGEPEPKIFNIPMNTDITHGPYLGDAGFGAAKLVSRPDVTGLGLPETITNDTLIIESIVGFSGDMDQKATVSPIKYNLEGALFDFAGATISSKANLNNHSTFTGLLDVQQLTVSSEDEDKKFSLKPFKMDISGNGDDSQMKGDYEAKSGVIEATIGADASLVLQSLEVKGAYQKANGADMMLGDAVGTFKDIVFTNAEVSADPIKVPEITFSSMVKQPDGTDLEITVKYSTKLDPSLLTAMKSPVDVKTADLELTFKSLPIEAIQKYQALIQDLSSGQGDDAVAQKMQSELLAITQMLVKNATATHIELHATSADGDLNADIDAGFKPGVELSEQELMMLMAMPDPQEILSILVGRANLDLSKGVTDKAGVTPMLQIMAADFVKLDGDTFKSEVQITDGQLLVNGTALPLFDPTATDENMDIMTEESDASVADDAMSEEPEVPMDEESDEPVDQESDATAAEEAEPAVTQ